MILKALAIVKRATVLPGMEENEEESTIKTFFSFSNSPLDLQNGVFNSS